jgi:hypothetical protein
MCNCPAELRNPAAVGWPRLQSLFRASQRGSGPAEMADRAFAAIQDERFSILPHPKLKSAIRARMEAILEAQTPPPGPG